MPRILTAEQLAAARTVRIAVGAHTLDGDLTLPSGASGLVIFAHGAGSGRKSPRNRHVASALVKWNLATLLVDLLTDAEEGIDEITEELGFDIPFLAARVGAVIEWAAAESSTARLPIGVYGASTGAAAALQAAADHSDLVRAIVSRGGRPDLAGHALELVIAPTLLVVGGQDPHALEVNRAALQRLTPGCRLEIVPGATHLFEEPYALDVVARLAMDWFKRHLRRRLL